MTSISESVQYPMQHDDWLRTIAIGGLLSFFGFLIIPLFLVYGYMARVIEVNLAGEASPPTFGDWGELLVTGLKVFVIGVIYFLIPAIVAAVTLGGSIAAFATGTSAGTATGVAGLLGGFFVTLVLGLLFGYIAVAGIINFVREDQISAAFDVDRLRQIVLSSEYAVAWLLSIGVFVVASVVAGILNVVPLIGAILGAFVFFYAQIVAADLWADGYTAAMAFESRDDRSKIEELDV